MSTWQPIFDLTTLVHSIIMTVFFFSFSIYLKVFVISLKYFGFPVLRYGLYNVAPQLYVLRLACKTATKKRVEGRVFRVIHFLDMVGGKALVQKEGW